MKKNGFTLMDVLVGTFLLVIVFLGIFGAYQLAIRVVSQSKNKVTADAIINGEIEKVRNLPYQSVGVMGGFPDGSLETIKSVIVNGLEYIVETRIDYVVDEADGISSPHDDCPNDYKKVQIKVSWLGGLAGQVELVTDVSPESLAQECAEIGGILSIQVFDAFGLMVFSPLIEIKDPITDEIIKTAVPIDGKHFFSLSPAQYKIVVSKTNYNSSRTYGIEEITTPEKPHQIVLEGMLTEDSFSIDRLSSMSIQVTGIEELGFPPIPYASFNLTGAKLLGFDAGENPVYKYFQNHIANELGLKNISNLEWDSYIFTILDPDLNLVEPLEPVSLAPNTNQNVTLIVAAENSLLVTVKDLATGEPIFSAEVRLNPNTQYTDENGQTYFIPLAEDNYTMEVQAPGYSSYINTFWVSGNMTKVINLNRIE